MSIKVFKQDRKSLAIIIYVAHVRCEGFIHADVEGVLVLLFKPRSELVDQPVLRNLAADFTHSVISDNLNASCLSLFESDTEYWRTTTTTETH